MGLADTFTSYDRQISVYFCGARMSQKRICYPKGILMPYLAHILQGSVRPGHRESKCCAWSCVGQIEIRAFLWHKKVTEEGMISQGYVMRSVIYVGVFYRVHIF